MGFFALDDADDGGDGHACFAGGFDCGDGGGAGGADVIDDDDAGTFFAEAFDAAAGAVGLLCFAYQESVEQRAARILLCTPGAGGCDIGDDWVSAHGEAADGLGLNSVLLEKFEDGVAGEAAALGMKRRGAAIDVVVAGAARRKFELTELETGAGEEGEKLLGVGGAGGIHQR